MTILTEQETLQRAAARLNLTVKAQFVPFSVSRSKDQKDKNLNWKVTLQRDGRDIIETDYSAGQGHCPSYKSPPKFSSGAVDKWKHRKQIDMECETGKRCKFQYESAQSLSPISSQPIVPDECSVIYALVMDSDVLNYSSFEQWAGDFGYDTDSRQAEKIYQDCLAIALKLRAGLGEQALSELAAACQDY
jgi:hypothetical protein